MSRKLFSTVFLVLLILISVVSADLFAADTQNAIDNGNVSIGAGFFIHKFKQADYYREGSGLFGDSDKISYLAGFSLNGELLLNKTFSFQSPLGFATGYRFQYGTGGIIYSFLGDELERKVTITNHIVYVSASFPLDSEKYYLLGISAGAGLSKYAYSEKWTKRSAGNTYPNYDKSANGQVFPIGAFFDWGADGIGGRIGADYIISKYKKIDGNQPKGDGMQYYLTIRYVI
jgi:hypothetical protein